MSNFPAIGDNIINSLPAPYGNGQFTTTVSTQLQLQNIRSTPEARPSSPTASYHTTIKNSPPSTTSPQSPSNSSLRETSAEASTVQTTPADGNEFPKIVCGFKPCKGRVLNSIAELHDHEAKAHCHHCPACPDAGYPSVRDLTFRHYGPVHGMAAEYQCGRCGVTCFRQDNHTRHLSRKRPCKATAVPQQYVCGRCGNETCDKKVHLGHLHRRGCGMV
ncbi:hypothetical protein CCHR01_09115 [Colletotrichum chrysophilum]|uniref:Uncharacterized protein n=1 Tax=Colletotrichum chrysophilum TaxID=1836956 RepID=A0AAD9AIJ4_9PEZI|nr:hypothetical protein CCHR01_09115 [Colletotrichum chrysophilum]